jgi:hypothetical protein
MGNYAKSGRDLLDIAKIDLGGKWAKGIDNGVGDVVE